MDKQDEQPTVSNPLEHVVMPQALTAENGAKYLFAGEFHTETETHCGYCDGTGINDEMGCECADCDGEGRYISKVVIDWDTIKRIYKLAVDKFAT